MPPINTRVFTPARSSRPNAALLHLCRSGRWADDCVKYPGPARSSTYLSLDSFIKIRMRITVPGSQKTVGMASQSRHDTCVKRVASLVCSSGLEMCFCAKCLPLTWVLPKSQPIMVMILEAQNKSWHEIKDSIERLEVLRRVFFFCLVM
jgi:hypothetical protein